MVNVVHDHLNRAPGFDRDHSFVEHGPRHWQLPGARAVGSSPGASREQIGRTVMISSRSSTSLHLAKSEGAEA